MKKFLTFVLAAVAALTTALVLTGPASARQLPGGNWVNSCWNAYVDRGTLYATCKDRRGNANDTAIDINGCRSFSNDDGELVCDEYGNNGGNGSGRDVSDIPGNWYATCENAYVDGGVLYAECQDKRGKYRSTSLNIRGCGNVENNNGQLVCTQ